MGERARSLMCMTLHCTAATLLRSGCDLDKSWRRCIENLTLEMHFSRCSFDRELVCLRGLSRACRPTRSATTQCPFCLLPNTHSGPLFPFPRLRPASERALRPFRERRPAICRAPPPGASPTSRSRRCRPSPQSTGSAPPPSSRRRPSPPQWRAPRRRPLRPPSYPARPRARPAAQAAPSAPPFTQEWLQSNNRKLKAALQQEQARAADAQRLASDRAAEAVRPPAGAPAPADRGPRRRTGRRERDSAERDAAKAGGK